MLRIIYTVNATDGCECPQKHNCTTPKNMRCKNMFTSTTEVMFSLGLSAGVPVCRSVCLSTEISIKSYGLQFMKLLDRISLKTVKTLLDISCDNDHFHDIGPTSRCMIIHKMAPLAAVSSAWQRMQSRLLSKAVCGTRRVSTGEMGGIAPHFQMKGVISDFSHKLKMAVAESVMGLNSLEFCPRKFVKTVSAPSISELYRHALGWSLGGGEACTLSPLISSVLFSQKILIRLKAKKLKMHKATQNAHRMKTRHTQSTNREISRAISE